MNFIDVILILFIGIGFILGFKDGFIRKLIGLIGFVVAVICAYLFSDDVGRAIEKITGIEYYFASIIAASLLFLLVVFLFSLLKRFVHPFDKVNNMLNQLVGAVVGVVQILFFASAVFLLLNIINLPAEKERENSFLYNKVYDIIPATVDYFQDYTPDTREIIRTYINEKDTLK